MSRRADGLLFVGRLSKNTRTRDLEEVFEPYGRLLRCDIKYGAEMAYAFIDFEDRRDAEDCLKYENGREICGAPIIVEWAKGNPRRSLVRGNDECYKCHRGGHWARDCPEDRYGGGGWRSSRRYRSPSPRRRRRSRSRSRDRRRSRSRSRDRRRRSRSRSPDRSSKRRRKSRSVSRDRRKNLSKSPSRSPPRKSESRSRSKSASQSKSPEATRDEQNGRSRSRSGSRGSSAKGSHSRSGSPDQDQS